MRRRSTVLPLLALVTVTVIVTGSTISTAAFAQTAAAAAFPVEVRSYDGSDNNINHPDWGRAGTPFRRQTTVDYEDGSGQLPAGADRASARQISNVVVAAQGSRLNNRGASDLVWQWGQFLDHDLDLTGTIVPAEAFNIAVPTGDPFFDPSGTGTQVIPFNRSFYEQLDGVRQQVNLITAYIDGSQIYGSDETRALALRTLDGTGRLKTSAGNMLPFNTTGLPNFPTGTTAFVAGDVRVNEQVGLTAMHTLWVREHNFWADSVRATHPEMDDEEIYQYARAVVVGELQVITYRDFLPILLGPNALPNYQGYRSTVSAAIENAFATAAYRFGHSMLSPTLRRLGSNGQTIPQGDLALKDAFFNQAALTSVGIEPYLRGMAKQRAQELDHQIVDAVRNFLFGAPGAGGFDLASLNIQRGRDHGLPSYNQLRRDYGLPQVNSFAQITQNASVRAKLAAVYDHPNQIDAWVGGLAEDHVPGGLVGPTFRAVLRDQFTRLRDGDRFWFERYLPQNLVQLVRSQNLAKVIRRNTPIRSEVQDNVFVVPHQRIDSGGDIIEIPN